MSHFGCDKCWPSEPSIAWEAVRCLPMETHLIDESHFIVGIRRCPVCAQRYLQVTTEQVDWADGDDPVSRTIIPLDEVEYGQLTDCESPTVSLIEGVGLNRRSLRFDWFKEAEPSIYWSTGVLVGPHD